MLQQFDWGPFLMDRSPNATPGTLAQPGGSLWRFDGTTWKLVRPIRVWMHRGKHGHGLWCVTCRICAGRMYPGWYRCAEYAYNKGVRHLTEQHPRLYPVYTDHTTD
jgi:hypothetical protein